MTDDIVKRARAADGPPVRGWMWREELWQADRADFGRTGLDLGCDFGSAGEEVVEVVVLPAVVADALLEWWGTIPRDEPPNGDHVKIKGVIDALRAQVRTEGGR